MIRLIIFMVRKKMGLAKNETFQFINQKSKTDFYYFTDLALVKVSDGHIEASSVSLNFLLSDECRIKRF